MKVGLEGYVGPTVRTKENEVEHDMETVIFWDLRN